MLTKTTYAKDINRKNSTTYLLTDIFNMIRKDEMTINKTKEYQNIPVENEEERRQYKKNNFSVFYPTICFYNSDSKTVNEHSKPTGLIQFDLDKKDNPNVNIKDLMEKLKSIPQLYYMFRSPSGGLKFALKTDFIKNENDTPQDLKNRFGKAYEISCEHILSTLGDLTLDKTAKGIGQACYISHDPDLYLNCDCELLQLNDICVASNTNPQTDSKVNIINQSPKPSSNATGGRVTHNLLKSIKNILGYFPKDLGWNDRRLINIAVFNEIGSDRGKALLTDHWKVDSNSKLDKDLASLAHYVDDHPEEEKLGINWLRKEAMKYGYNPGRATKNLELEIFPQENNTFEDSIEKARNKIFSTIQDAFKNKKSVCISVSPGIGKSETMLDYISNLPPSTKVLYTTNSNDLAADLLKRFKGIHRKEGNNIIQLLRANHIKGRELTCINEETKKAYKSENIAIPHYECNRNRCSYFNRCSYISQFDPEKGNTRFMTANELYNEPSYFNKEIFGSNEEKIDWIPDIIILDDPLICLDEDDNLKESMNSKYRSITNIISYCCSEKLNDRPKLIEAINKYKNDINHDWHKMDSMTTKEKPRYESRDQYIKAVKEYKKNNDYSIILNLLYSYAFKNEEKALHGMHVIERKENMYLVVSRIKKIHKRFDGIPLIILDGTASEPIVKQIYPDIKFVLVNVKKRSDINTYQMHNKVITKKWSSNENNRKALVSGLCEGLKTRGYSHAKIGLITYKTIPGKSDFDKWLGEQIKADVIGHFGNIRGKNDFVDVDVLLVIGRHELSSDSLDDYMHAIYDTPVIKENPPLKKIPSQMTNNRVAHIYNHVNPNPQVENIREHYCRAENIQAVCRGRLFHESSKNKCIFYFSCQSLGLGIEVDDFFKFEDWFKIPEALLGRTQTDEHIRNKSEARKKNELANRKAILEKRGYPSIKNTTESFIAIGFSKDFSRRRSIDPNVSNKSRACSDLMISIGYKLIENQWIYSSPREEEALIDTGTY